MWLATLKLPVAPTVQEKVAKNAAARPDRGTEGEVLLKRRH
jgi:hypothetical protein